MPVAATTAPSPGWYPDANDPDHLRWWDGDGWTNKVTDTPGGAEEPAFIAGIREDDFVRSDEDDIEFSWEDESDDFLVSLADFEPELVLDSAPEPVAEASPPAIRGFAPEPEPFHAPRHEPPPAPEPAPVLAPKPARRPIPRLAVKGSIGLVVCAALAAQITNMLSGDAAPARKAPAATAMGTADKTCLKEWNTTASGTAAELRVTLGQFAGAYARVGRVDPLPGTLMGPDSCALTVYDPSTDTNVVFASGVPDQIGYMDVTAYPRAKAYGWPKSANQANVAVREDGTIAAL